MRTENCVLVDAFTGRQICGLTRLEASGMEERGTASCIRLRGRRTNRYRLVVPVQPSNSTETSPMLTVSDTRAVAGLNTPTVEQAERLDGWGFPLKRAMCDACESVVPMPHPSCALNF